MDRQTITIDVHFDSRWHPAAELVVLEPSAGAASPSRLAYLDDYIVGNIDSLGTTGAKSLGENHPLDFEVWVEDSWPAFMLDIVPSGSARRWWRKRLAAEQLSEAELEFVLLRDHTVGPIGHLRVAPVEVEPRAPIPFSKDEVCRRSASFLEHAADMGAAIGGATGAGGDAPKVLLSEDATGSVYPDSTLPDQDVLACWLVKWPRGHDTRRDRLVLETEHKYAHALAQIGLEACPGRWRQVEDGKPSLWMPRFDRRVEANMLERLPVESFYSLAGVRLQGASVPHLTYLEALARAVERRGQLASLAGLVKEYVCRDLLDVVLGNSDNHGRNRAVLRGEELRLAPIYDLAPMVMDPEGVVRTTRWGEWEQGGAHIDWRGVCGALSRWVEPSEMEAHLSEFAERLLPLPDLLNDAGLSEEVWEFPRIYLRQLPDVLGRWGLR